METRALRYFQAVAEFGSYSRAAEVLRISQPAVSRQVRTLENSLGHKLFLRQSHGVSLTEAGQALLAEIEHDATDKFLSGGFGERAQGAEVALIHVR